MSYLETLILSDLRKHPAPRYLVAVCDMARLDDDLRAKVRETFEGHAYPLLLDPSLHALEDYSPLLLAPRSEDDEGWWRLLGGFQHTMRNALHGWIVSKLPPQSLARHLSRATQAYGPDGASYLLRLYDPAVIPVLHCHADSLWWRAVLAPIITWRYGKGDTDLQRWACISGGGSMDALPPLPLVIDEPLWNELVNDPLPNRLLQAAETYDPALFSAPCRSVRLAQVEAVLADARNAGLSVYEDLHDYVLMTLRSGANRLGSDRVWQHALRMAASGAGQLGDVYLATRQSLQEKPRP